MQAEPDSVQLIWLHGEFDILIRYRGRMIDFTTTTSAPLLFGCVRQQISFL
jgi:hypothetical protein